jgi:hypothetical protein
MKVLIPAAILENRVCGDDSIKGWKNSLSIDVDVDSTLKPVPMQIVVPTPSICNFFLSHSLMLS